MMTIKPSSSFSSPPRVSVIIPVRNDPDNLRRCLDAIAASTVRDVEVIVVDDASSDETAFIAHRRGARVLRSDLGGGPAVARNAGAAVAEGDILLFVDADVVLHPDAIERMLAAFDSQPAPAAVFGSYDTTPHSPALISQYKNLFHHFVHQQAREEAATFWSGCGAVRRDVFAQMGGFDADRYDRPCIEDIDLGVRLHQAGHRILLDKAMQATHRKRWTLAGMIRSDLFDRGIPWTRLILRERNLPNDLNLGLSQRLSAMLAGLFVVMLAAVAVHHPQVLLAPLVAMGLIVAADAWTAHFRVPRALKATWSVLVIALLAIVGWSLPQQALWLVAPLAGVVLLNMRCYGFFLRQRGLLFTAAVLPLHVLYYLYSGLALVIGILQHLTSRDTRAPRPTAVVPPAAIRRSEAA